MTSPRRNFLTGMLSLLGLGAAARPAPTTSHYFDWSNKGPFTTDPRYAGKLKYGEHNHVLCDGKDMGAVRRYVTGPNGWIEFAKLDEHGRVYEDPQRQGQLAVDIVYGNVEHVDLREKA